MNNRSFHFPRYLSVWFAVVFLGAWHVPTAHARDDDWEIRRARADWFWEDEFPSGRAPMALSASPRQAVQPHDAPPPDLLIDDGNSYMLTQDAVVGRLVIGQYNSGALSQTAYTLTSTSFCTVGLGTGSHGEFDLSGGTFNSQEQCLVGLDGTGVYNQTGGTANFSTPTDNGGALGLAYGFGSQGSFTLYAGAVKVGPAVAGVTNGMDVGIYGAANFQLNGGTLTRVPVTESLFRAMPAARPHP